MKGACPGPWLAASLVTLLAGCGTLGPAGNGEQTRDLLEFYRYAATLEPSELAAEYRNFRNWVRAGRCTPDRLRLAILVVQPEAGGADWADPGGVLEPCLEGPGSPSDTLGDLAFLLGEQIELTGRLVKAERRAKGLQERLGNEQALRQQLRKAKEEVEALREQLEALKDIERSIRQRD